MMMFHFLNYSLLLFIISSVPVFLLLFINLFFSNKYFTLFATPMFPSINLTLGRIFKIFFFMCG